MTTPPSSRRGLWLLGWLLLTIYFVSPPREVFDETLDRSNYATYAHFVTHGFQWGTEVMPMPGPLGFVLFGYCYSGELYGARLIGDLLLCAAFSAMLLHLFRRSQSGLLSAVWLGVMVLVVPFVDDLLLDTAVLLSAVCLLLSPPDKPDRWAYLGSVVLAFVALIKGTHIMMCAAVFGTVTLLGILERRPARVVRPFTVFVIAFLFFWTLANQNVRHLWDYLVATSQLASGYSLTMGLEEEPFFFQVGLALAVGLMALLAWTAGFGIRTLSGAATFFFLCLFAFLKWKHGYVRADGHIYIFFGSSAIVAITAWLLAFSSLANSGNPRSATPRWRRLIGLALLTAVTTFATIGCVQFWTGRFIAVVVQAPDRFASHLRYLVSPRKVRTRLDQELAVNRRNATLSEIRNDVGKGTIDFFGNEEGILLLNDLNYRPRPMGGGTFNVVNRWLQRRNEAYVLSPHSGPAWQLLKVDVFDERLPAGDDGLALRAILDCYKPVLLQRKYLLLKRTSDRPASAQPTLIDTVRVEAGKAIRVPAAKPGEMILFSLHAPFNTYGKLRSFVYRPPVLMGRFFTSHYPFGRQYVLKPALVEDPIILSPFLEGTTEILKLYEDAPGNVVKALTLNPAPGFSTDQLTVSFYSAPRPKQAEPGDVEEILTYQKHPLFSRKPAQVVTQETGIRELNAEPIALIHAPGSVTWNQEPGDQQISFSYGLLPKTYEEGTTNGVEFNVELLWPPNDGRILFKRLLRPRTVVEDRGMQRSRITLPPYEPGAQIRIRTDPGPDGDGAWDQSYLTRVVIKNGPPVAAQYNGLGVVPADERLPHEAVAISGTTPVYLIHAPGSVALKAPAGAKTLHAEIGLLPGAYLNGGNTDGVEFTVLTQSATGAQQQIWRRLLNPVHQPGDRGNVPIAVSLPPLAAGTKLLVTTGVGPNGDRSWDQSFITNVRFE